ncbi:MAG: hypothetical protein ACTMHL_15100 [Janibacter sp.]
MTSPEDEVRLPQNLPTKVHGARLIAYNILEDRAVLSNDRERSMVHPDSVVDVAGSAYRVTALVPHSDERPEHRPNGWISLVPEEAE